ncbi:MAG TPA: hypothetical protein VMY05_09685 [Acidobacteriota bacterium]|nr:hypothetical protein [Acidobacteriota bacterium]
MEATELAVGDSTRLEIIFSTKRYRSRITKSPSIETNEGEPHKRVRIVADVLARPDSTFPIIIKPYKLDISQFGEKVRDEMKFNITNVSEQDLKVRLVYQPEGYFDLELPGTVKAGKTAQGVLKLRKEAIDTSFDKSVTIELDDESASRFTIPIKRKLRIPGQSSTAAASESP